MNKANEMRNIIDQVIADKEKEAEDRAIFFCDYTLESKITCAAEKGKKVVKSRVPAYIEMSYVIDHLKEQGYGVKKLIGRRLRIGW